MTLLLPPLATSTVDRSAYPFDLIRHSTQVEAAKVAQKLALLDRLAFQPGDEYYGAQLEPWRDRDLLALTELFAGEDLEVIDADIYKALLVLWPEPCWEDDPFISLERDREFDFLAEFLE
jgi:hypothetical protein